MPEPRKIDTDKRREMIEKIECQMEAVRNKLCEIAGDLSKPHVDDKAAAKELLAKIKKYDKALAAF